MKKSVLILSGVLLVSLASCGEHEGTSSAAPTYSVDTTMAYLLDTSVQFAAEWNDKQFEIVDSNHAKVAAVTASMVKGFDSKQAQFNSDIAATVSYQGQTIPFTYQIRSSYSTPSYSVYLQNDQSVRLDGVAESIAVDAFTIPEVITELPAPANEWPVKEFSYSPVARKIMNLNLSKNVEVVSATLDRLCKVVPAKEGKIAYDANGMLVVSTGLTYDKALIGVAPSFAGETLAIPATVSSVYGCAFSNAFPQVKTLTIPASVVSLSSDLV